LHAARKYDEAEQIGVKAVAAYDQESNADDPALVSLLNRVAWNRYFVGRYADAEPLYLRALSIEERLSAGGILPSAQTAGGLAHVYDHGRVPGDAGKYYCLALAREEAALGSDNAAVIERSYRFFCADR
jgi:Tetratricopeptide repeat